MSSEITFLLLVFSACRKNVGTTMTCRSCDVMNISEEKMTEKGETGEGQKWKTASSHSCFSSFFRHPHTLGLFHCIANRHPISWASFTALGTDIPYLGSLPLHWSPGHLHQGHLRRAETVWSDQYTLHSHTVKYASTHTNETD